MSSRPAGSSAATSSRSRGDTTYGAFFETGALAAILLSVLDPRRLALGQPISGRSGLVMRW